jgi:ATP synthase protein I
MHGEKPTLLRQVGAKAQLKLEAQRAGPPALWLGWGMSGLIGWSVSLPTLAGGMLGLWLDRQHPGQRSWTLVLLMAGLTLGCANAWYWVAQQNAGMHPAPPRLSETDEHDE